MPDDNTYVFQPQEAASLMLHKCHNLTFFFLLNILSSSILVVRGCIHDDIKLVVPEMTPHQMTNRKFRVTI